jgi:transposase-like protein
LEELLSERGVEVDHVTVYRWVLRFTPLLARPLGRAGTPSVTAGRWTRPGHRHHQGPTRRVTTDHAPVYPSARVMLVGHAFIQNLRRGHDELATEEPITRRLPVAFDESAKAT